MNSGLKSFINIRITIENTPRIQKQFLNIMDETPTCSQLTSSLPEIYKQGFPFRGGGDGGDTVLKRSVPRHQRAVPLPPYDSPPAQLFVRCAGHFTMYIKLTLLLKGSFFIETSSIIFVSPFKYMINKFQTHYLSISSSRSNHAPFPPLPDSVPPLESPPIGGGPFPPLPEI